VEGKSARIGAFNFGAAARQPNSIRRGLPGRDDLVRPAHRAGRVDRHHLAGDQPVEQVTDPGDPLLDARRRDAGRRGAPARIIRRRPVESSAGMSHATVVQGAGDEAEVVHS
jgi:hypothetical protein